MEEEKIVIPSSEIEGIIDIEPYEQETTILETFEEVSVNAVEEMTIDVTEAVGIVNGVGVSTEHEHEMVQIKNLMDTLKKLGSPHEIYSQYGGIAEFRQWKTSGEVGRFVSLVYQDEKDPITGGNTFIEVCNGNADIYGVTVQDSAFCGYQNKDYCLLETEVDNDKFLNCAKVCLLGVARVKQGADYHPEGRDAQVGDYVVPGADGCAVYSKNKIGFRVVAVGQLSGASNPQWNYRYVDIALVPQNDNVARVMAELEGTKNNLGNLSIQIGKLEDDINNSITSVIPGMNETLEDLKDIASDTQKQLDSATEALGTAQKISNEASAAIEQVKDDYMTAISDAQEAKKIANNALSDVAQIEDNMAILKQHEDKIVGFFDAANEDEASLATIVKQTGDITLIKQKADKNGAAIEHLVAHADRYCVGERSLSYGLSYEEALGILGKTGKVERNGYIYVPTVTHTENSPIYQWISTENGLEFIAGKVYVWMCDSSGPDDTSHRWQETSLKISLGIRPMDELMDGDLWYSPYGEIVDNVWQYEPETLYRWTAYDDDEGVWIAVARANDGNTRSMSYINQTAEAISSTVTNLAGDVSNITQEVDNISSTVADMDGTLTRINQTAEDITLGAYSPKDGVSSLEILLNGMRSVSSYSEHVLVGEFGGSPTSETKKYTIVPIWTDTGFSFAEATEATEEDYPMYYFNSDKTTYYCKQIDDDTYEIYTIGNQAMASINTRVTDTESAITDLTEFQTDAGTRLTAVEQKSNENSAQIASIATIHNIICSEIKVELTEEEQTAFINAIKYHKPPIWDVNEGKFKFSGNASEDGVYCIINDETKYYKIIDTASGKGYELYELSSLKFAAIEQEVDENGASISMVVDNGQVKGGVIATAINDQSEVLIEADKIGIDGTAVFKSSFTNDKTTINGDYITTGVLASNNYIGPKTYVMYGAMLDEENLKIVKGTKFSDCIYYTPIIEGTFDPEDNPIYYVDKIEVDQTLFSDKQDTSEYYVSKYDFDLTPENIEMTGMKIDLNVGTIHSKNLQLNRDGDLSITGWIQATGGYIGDEVHGFTIAEQNGQLLYIVPKSEIDGVTNTLEKGTYYFKYNDKDYKFTLTYELTEGDKITINNDISYYKVNGEFEDFLEETSGNIPESKLLTFVDASYYYLGQGQKSVKGNREGTPGMFISPEGVGLGNGNFYVDDMGNVSTSGIVSMKSGGNEVVKIENGNLTLAGNITLGGSITWSTSSNPLKVLYRETYTATAPTKDDYEEAYKTGTTWHTELQDTDYYASYSYDGGVTWTTPIKIQGEDGQSGEANIDEETIFDMLTDGGETQGIFPFYGEYTGSTDKPQLYINAEYIKAGTLSGITVESTDIFNHTVEMSDGHIQLWPPEYDTSLVDLGIYKINNHYEPRMRFGQGSGDGLASTGWIYKTTNGFGMMYNTEEGNAMAIEFNDYTNAIEIMGDVNFSGGNVTGLKITFG